MKNPKATQVLILGLKDTRHMVRIHVAAQLGERKDRKAVDALIATSSLVISSWSSILANSGLQVSSIVRLFQQYKRSYVRVPQI